MNWAVPIGITIGAFIGSYFLTSHSLSLALLYTSAAFVAAIIISILLSGRNQKSHKH